MSRPDLASPERRIAAWAADCALLVASFVAPQLAAVASAGVAAEHSTTGSLALALGISFVGLVLPPLLVVVVRVVGEASRFGATPGKLLLGVRVVDVSGRHRIGMKRALVRRVWHLLSRAACFLGFAGVMNDPQRRGWADLRAGTLVVRTRGAVR